MGNFKHIFPFNKVPSGSRIVLYGAGDVGTDFAKQIKQSADLELVAMLDMDFYNKRRVYSDVEVLHPSEITRLTYDYVVIGLLNGNGAVTAFLDSMGVPKERVINSVAIDHTYTDIKFVWFVENYMEHFFGGLPLEKVEGNLQQQLYNNLNEYVRSDVFEQSDTLINMAADLRTFINRLHISYERNMYGHLYSMLKYAGFQHNNPLCCPAVEHALLLQNTAMTSSPVNEIQANGNPTNIVLSKFRKKALRTIINRPIFTVGPYIEYADICYDDEKMAKEKQRLGKNLLVFTIHTWPSGGQIAPEGEFIDYLKAQVKCYDSVRVSLYYINFTPENIQRYADIGVEAICMGIYCDRRFLSHLKTAMTLADHIVFDYLAVNVAYAIQLKKPFSYFQRKVITITDLATTPALGGPVIEDAKQRLEAAALLGIEQTEESMAHLEYMYGFSHIKTPEEMRMIFEINREIYEACEGNVLVYESESRRHLDRLSASANPDDQKKALLLLEALQ